MALAGSLSIPARRLGRVLRNASPAVVRDPEVELRLGVAHFGAHLEPLCCLNRVLGPPIPKQVGLSERERKTVRYCGCFERTPDLTRRRVHVRLGSSATDVRTPGGRSTLGRRVEPTRLSEVRPRQRPGPPPPTNCDAAVGSVAASAPRAPLPVSCSYALFTPTRAPPISLEPVGSISASPLPEQHASPIPYRPPLDSHQRAVLAEAILGTISGVLQRVQIIAIQVTQTTNRTHQFPRINHRLPRRNHALAATPGRIAAAEQG